jgi:hypothetical protein
VKGATFSKHGGDACLAMLVRAPDAGQVKTRLAQDLDRATVLQLYTLFVEDLLLTIAKTELSLRIFFSPADAGERVSVWLGGRPCLPQSGDDLGERMRNALGHCLSEGFRRVAVIGSDSPDLPASVLTEAFSALDTHDAVIGPATDGGYYLIGFKNRLVPEVFGVTSWGEPDVFVKTMEILTEAGSTVRVLDPWPDIDTIEDLNDFAARHVRDAPESWRTVDFLRVHGRILA